MDYWKECIEESFEDAEIPATKKQIDIVVSWISGAHENYGMAFGHDCISNPMVLENKKIKKELEKEQNKIICEYCNGKGRVISYGGTFQSNSECYKCRGKL